MNVFKKVPILLEFKIRVCDTVLCLKLNNNKIIIINYTHTMIIRIIILCIIV